MRRSINFSEGLENEEVVYYYDSVKEDFDEFILGIDRSTKRKQKIEYYNIPCCFDIETSSFYDNGQKAGCMYIWMFSIDDHIIIGRTWDEFLMLLNKLHDKLSLHNHFRRLICYIQNMGFEFQWFCHRIKWAKVFATDERAPLTALTENGIEFRCSYRLSGYNLQKMGEQLTKYNIKKMVGDLDYKKLRLPADPSTGFKGTPLTDKEMGYCINDVRVLSAYIREKIEHDGGITKIPLTKTGYVRLYCKEHIFGGRSHRHDYKVYHQFMQNLTLDPDEFKMLLRAFQGGFTHASTFFSGQDKPITNITSWDYCSKYPASMFAYPEYPMGKGEFYDPEDMTDFEYQLKYYACLFDVRFIGLKPTILYENYISLSKCTNVKNAVTNNGRVVSADEIITTITNVDFDIIKNFYVWDEMQIGRFIRYEKNYLPRDFVSCILDFYETKSKLKGVEHMEVEYAHAKELLNSTFGCCCTNPCKDTVTYVSSEEGGEDPGWTTSKVDLEKELDKYNKKKDRFLFWPWGVWCTALSRRDIAFYGVLKAGPEHYLYTDTDSVKFTGEIKDFEKEYNEMILRELAKACKYHNIDISRVAPKTKDGEVKPLGLFEFDGHYSKAKFLGAKRYFVKYSSDPRNRDKKGKLMLTVAGLNKKKGAEYLQKFKDPFEKFKDDMIVPAEYSGRQTATYIDEPIYGKVTDYLGNTGVYNELSALHLEESEYTMSIADDYLNYLLGIQEREDI